MANTTVRDQIESAARAHGVDPAALLAIARLESNYNPAAVNPSSGASGLFQFMPTTARGMGLADPTDPVAASNTAARLTNINSRSLTRALGRAPTTGELYLAHQQGAGGARALLSNPDANAVDALAGVYGSRARARAAVTQNGGNSNMTAGQFAGLWTSRADQAAGAAAPQTALAAIDAMAPTPQTRPPALAYAGSTPPQSAVRAISVGADGSPAERSFPNLSAAAMNGNLRGPGQPRSYAPDYSEFDQGYSGQPIDAATASMLAPQPSAFSGSRASGNALPIMSAAQPAPAKVTGGANWTTAMAPTPFERGNQQVAQSIVNNLPFGFGQAAQGIGNAYNAAANLIAPQASAKPQASISLPTPGGTPMMSASGRAVAAGAGASGSAAPIMRSTAVQVANPAYTKWAADQQMAPGVDFIGEGPGGFDNFSNEMGLTKAPAPPRPVTAAPPKYITVTRPVAAPAPTPMPARPVMVAAPQSMPIMGSTISPEVHAALMAQQSADQRGQAALQASGMMDSFGMLTGSGGHGDPAH